jgi:hypothetical protein
MDRCIARPHAQFGDRVMTAMTGNSSLVPSLIFHEAIVRSAAAMAARSNRMNSLLF